MLTREIETNYPEHRYLDFYIVPLQAVDSREEGAVIILRDVTHERETAEQTIESERLRAITLLAAGVAHEIGNPLNSLNIHLQLMAREMQSLPEESRDSFRELLDIARNEVSRLDQIIHQFLGALRPAHPCLESAQLETLLRQTLDLMKNEISDRNVHLTLELPDHLPAVQVDHNQIKQAFYNILKNAVQAMPSGGALQITLSETDRFVAVAFSDAGPGISPWDLSAIFEPFYTTKSSGSGLGMMILQRIIRDHGGEIEVRTEPEHGTTVTVFIPREDRRIRLLKAHRSAQRKPKNMEL
jgi:signal transduction histidine kinase